MGFKGWRFWVPLVLLFASPAWAESPVPERHGIVVEVLNHAGAAREELSQAEGEAARIFRAAGLEIQWVDCSGNNCHHVPRENEFVLNIVPDGKTSTDLVFGVAFLGPNGEGKYCDVFFRRIEAAASGNGRNISRLLGTVAAHELGHLLLGCHSHSGAGIMMSRWKEETLRRVEMGSLLFSGKQAALISARRDRNELLLARGERK